MVTEHLAAVGLRGPAAAGKTIGGGIIVDTFMQVMAAAFETRLLRLREQRHLTGPGEYKTPTQHDRGRYTGAVLRQLRAERGVGRPLRLVTAPTFESAVKLHGSQRKAAAALGISLGKLQRGLRKAA